MSLAQAGTFAGLIPTHGGSPGLLHLGSGRFRNLNLTSLYA